MRRVVVTGLGMVSNRQHRSKKVGITPLPASPASALLRNLMHPLSAAVLPVKLKILKSKNIFRQKKLAVSTVLFN